MADGDKTKALKVGTPDHQPVAYSFSVTITVESPRDEARLRKLIDAEFALLTAAVEQKRQKRS